MDDRNPDTSAFPCDQRDLAVPPQPGPSLQTGVLESAGKSQGAARIAILVLGAHRSGTSVLTRLINLLGAALPKNLMGPGKANVRGHWEPTRLVELNDQMLHATGGAWWNPRPIPREWFSTPEALAFTARAATIIAEEFESAPLMVIKDPRICRLAPIYLAAFEQLEIESRVVLPLRHPGEAMNSVVNRDGRDPHTVELLWIRHLLEAEEASRSCRRVWTSYGDLLSNWRKTLGMIAETLALTWPNSRDSVAAAVEAVIDPKLRHFDIEQDSPPLGIGPLALRLWQAAQDGLASSEVAVRAKFDAIRLVADELDRLNSVQVTPPPVAPCVQVFANHGAGYEETLSVCKTLASESWETVRFEHLECLHTDCRHRLRIDVVNEPALVEVAVIRVVRDADHTVLYEASSEEEFRRLDHSVGVLTCFDGDILFLLATDVDPQLLLPLLPDFRGAAWNLELNLRVTPAGPALVRRFHELAGENQTSVALGDKLKSRTARLEAMVADRDLRLTEARAAMEAAQARATGLARDLDTARNEAAGRQRAVKTARGETEEHRLALEAVRRNIVERQRALDAIRGELAVAHGELHGIKSSLLWRLSAPLRRIGRFASRQACSVGKRLAEIREVLFRTAIRFPWNRRLRRLQREVNLIRQSRLIDAHWYFSRYRDAWHGKPDPVLHYLCKGALHGYNPTPLFETRWYLERNPDVAKAGENPLVHYLRTGGNEGRDPNPLFDSRWYLEENPAVAKAGQNPLVHYLNVGANEGRDPNPLFDSDWYLAHSPDVAADECNPLLHYMDRGWRECRDPGPHFDGNLYLEQNPDVAAAGVNPLVHFIFFGWREGRRPNANYDLRAVFRETGDARTSGIKPILDYLNRRGGMGGMAGGGAGTRKDDWDRFHTTPDEIGWRERMDKVPDGRRPTISVVMPVHRTPLPLLERVVQSVIAQEYGRWELCIADDGSDDESLREWLETRARAEPRIKLAINKHNSGISRATNDALALCTGDFVALLDHDDELALDALGEVAALLAEHPETDVIYSDQDKMDATGRRYQPFHKPAWSPVFFLGVMYVGHLLVVRRATLEQVGGCDPRFDKVQDYELMLRLSEVTGRIRHIPKLLYHWRAISGSVAASTTAKTGIEDLQVAAVAAHLKRRGVAAEAVCNPRHAHRVLLEPAKDQPQPFVSIIIPSAAGSPLLAGCLSSIVEKTTYAEFEVLLLVRKDSIKTDIQVRNLAAARSLARVRVLEYDFAFNYSRVNNYAASLARGPLLVFLNDDTEIITPAWLEIMATHLSLPGVGAVGPRLLFPDGTVQHAGVVLGFRGTADHVMRGFPGDADGYFGSLSASREVSAVTGACLMTHAATYEAVGGMKECFASVYQDVDLCLRIRQLGLSNVYVANVELVHHESSTRGPDYDRVDREILIDRWRDTLAADPCYNINFTRNRHDYTLKWLQA